jgi:hypothetical protein
MPSLDSVHATVSFTPTPAGPQYIIVRTTEVDSYETSPPAVAVRKLLTGKKAVPRSALAAALKPKPPVGDNFGGTDRKAAKLSIPQAQPEVFPDLQDLIASLEPEEHMIHHKPRITITATSKRTKEEMRNVRVQAFLYAASREGDNDFHLIIGRDPARTPEIYMTMEVSGLPQQASPSFGTFKETRDAFQKFFGTRLPGFTYDFYHPPIPVTIAGSLFFDMTHSSGQRPGPPSLKSRMPTIWEVHPVTAITLGP